MFFGADYYPEHRDPDFWDYDLDNMREAGINCLRIAEFAWSRFEPNENDFRFDWLGTFVEKAAKRNIDILMCVPFRSAPAWMVEKEPDILLTVFDGRRLAFGSRYTFCINHPYFCEREEVIAQKQAGFFRGFSNVIGWHLCNEHGDEPDCHCPVCKKKFQQWLADKYGDIANLNKSWGLEFWSLEFNHFEQIPTPAFSKTYHNPGHKQNWCEFRSDCTIEALALQADSIKPLMRPEQFITTNNQSLWNNRTDYYKMAGHLDICGTNYYPPYGENMRSVSLGLSSCRSYKNQQKFLVLELRNGPHMVPNREDNTPVPGEVERLTMHCYTNGAQGTFYFRWKACPFGCEQAHGTIVGYDGKPKRIYSEVKETGRKLKKIAEVIDNTEIKSEIAFLYDFPNRWMMEIGGMWNGDPGFCMDFAKELFRAVNDLPYNVDTIGRDQDFSGYQVLVVPILGLVEDELAGKLAAFVKQGGTLIWHPLSGIKNHDSYIYPDRIHPVLKELFGVNIAEFATLGKNETAEFVWRGQQYDGTAFCDLPSMETAESLAEYTGSFYKGVSALASRQVGKGRVYYCMTFAKYDFYRAFFGQLFKDLKLEKIFDGEIPETIEMKAHTNSATGEKYIFMVSHSAQETVIPNRKKYRDIYNGEDIAGDIIFKPYAARVIASAR